MVLRLGMALVMIGGATKGAIGFYRKVKSKKFFDTTKLAKDYYKGGFQSPMSRREAQLILNVREGQDIKKIRENHRRLMLTNHPDNQGSTFLATKINEAKELLIKNN